MMELNIEEIIKALNGKIANDVCDYCSSNKSKMFCEGCDATVFRNSLALIKALTEESQKWQEAYDCSDAACRELSSKCDELTEENEKLRNLFTEVQQYNEAWVADNGKLRQELKAAKADIVRNIRKMLECSAYTPKPYGTGKVVDWYEIDKITKDFLEENK